MPSSPPSKGQPLASPSSARPTAITSADTSPRLRHNLVSLSAAALSAAFFLPWVNILGGKISGLDIQKNVSSYKLVWVMPALGLVVLLLNMAKQNTDLIRRVAALCPFAILVYSLNQIGTNLFQILDVGAWLALLAGVVLLFISGEGKSTTPL